MNTRPARVARGLTAASIAVFVAALSHAAGGGDAPGTVGVVLAIAFSSMISVALAGRSLSIIRLSVGVVLSQFVFHALFGVGAGASADLTVTSGGHHGAMAMDAGSLVVGAGAAAIPTGTGGLGVQLADVVAAQLCSGMWIAHALAAALTVVALRHGEATFWRLLALAGLGFQRLMRPLGTEPLPAMGLRLAGSVFSLDHLRDLAVFLGGLRHRGPPACVRFAN